jgi:hypothetical protein
MITGAGVWGWLSPMAESDSQLGLIRVPVGEAGLRARPAPPAGGGWLLFAALVVFGQAAISAVIAVLALSKDDSFVSEDVLVVSLKAVGIASVIVCLAQAFVGLLILTRNPVGALLGIAMAVLSALLAVMFILANPVWSIVVIVVDLFVIFALWAYGLRR